MAYATVCGHELPAGKRGRPPKLCDRCKPPAGRPAQAVAVAEPDADRVALVESWRRSVNDGSANERCDELVRQIHDASPSTGRLLDAIIAGRGLVADLNPLLTPPRPRADPQALTEREEQVLFALADGLSDKEIAGDLGIAHDTVKEYMDRMRAKLGARNRTHAVALAYHRGLLIPRRAA